MRTFAQKQNPPHQKPSANLTKSNNLAPAASHQAVHARAPITTQPDLEGHTPGDIYEQEADHLSEQVMRMPEPPVRRACACGGGCPKCQTEQAVRKHERLQTKRVQAGDARPVTTPSIVHEVVGAPGQPLNAATQGLMEPRFGHDFSRVRVHTDVKAAESARALNARAYTVGNDVAFGAGQYAPETSDGRRLLAHELSHVVQQSASFIRLQRKPDTKDTLTKQYDIAIEKGDKDWKEDEINVLQATLARLSPKDKGIVKGYKFVRWSTPQTRGKNDPTYIKPDPPTNEKCLHEYAPSRGIYRITAYDECFGDPEARPGTDITHRISTGEFHLLHEIGHAAQVAEQRQAFLAQDTADKALKNAQNKYKQPEDQKAHKSELKALEDTLHVANDVLHDANGRAFNEFKTLMKGKKIISTAVTSTTDPSKYTDADYAEAFAETFAASITDPASIKKEYPAVYEWMQKNKYLKK